MARRPPPIPRQAAKQPAFLVPPVFWEIGVLPWVEKHARTLALCLIAIAVVRIAATWSVFSNTNDEAVHIAAGVQYLAQHIYSLETQHPPLARIMAALGPYLDGARPQGKSTIQQEGVAVLYHDRRPEQTLLLARLGVLPFFILACVVVYFWAAHHFGRAAAVLSLGLFTMLPPVLAHAGLACTDMALTACLGAAFYSLIRWAEAPTLGRSLLLGLAAALAALSKFTSLGYLPAGAVLVLLSYIAITRPAWSRLLSLAKERALPFGIAVVTGAMVIWAFFLFSFGPVPAPKFFEGIGMAMLHNAGGHQAYLLGEVGSRGWWYYFPVVLSVKTPIAFLVLVGVGVWVCWKWRARPVCWLPLAFSLGILLPAMAGHVNIGVRHILPVYIGFSMVAALALLQLAQNRKWAGMAALLLVLWMAAAGALSHPDYLSYFNEFVSREPERVLVDSDLDWNQDVKRLAKRLRELGATQVNYGSIYSVDGDLQSWPGLPPVKSINPVQPAAGWTAVSPTTEKTNQYGLYYRYPNLKPWFEYLQPRERVGAFLLYYVPPASLSH